MGSQKQKYCQTYLTLAKQESWLDIACVFMQNANNLFHFQKKHTMFGMIFLLTSPEPQFRCILFLKIHQMKSNPLEV